MDLRRLPDRLLRRLRVLTKGNRQPLSQEEKWAVIDRVREAYGITTFVESGTFLGDTIERFKNSFSRLYSIELQYDLCDAAQRRFTADENVTIIHGDSGKVLKELLETIEVPALFWLDGHYSSEFYIGETFVRTARGEKDTPIVEELHAVLAASLPHAILVDDARLFGIDKDYPSIEQIGKILRTSRFCHRARIMRDIIGILPRGEL
jgi:hypothetical protein